MIEEGSLVVLESDGTVTVGISINREIEEPVDCLISTTPVTALGNLRSLACTHNPHVVHMDSHHITCTYV